MLVLICSDTLMIIISHYFTEIHVADFQRFVSRPCDLMSICVNLKGLNFVIRSQILKLCPMTSTRRRKWPRSCWLIFSMSTIGELNLLLFKWRIWMNLDVFIILQANSCNESRIVPCSKFMNYFRLYYFYSIFGFVSTTWPAGCTTPKDQFDTYHAAGHGKEHRHRSGELPPRGLPQLGFDFGLTWWAEPTRKDMDLLGGDHFLAKTYGIWFWMYFMTLICDVLSM